MDMHSIKKARISVYYSRWSRGRKSCVAGGQVSGFVTSVHDFTSKY